MGCLQSKPSLAPAKPTKSSSNAQQMVRKILSKDEVRMRIVAPEQSQTFIQSGISIRYAWATQRGYYPDSPDKDNQDSYSVASQLSDKLHEASMFGVYDGHGVQGHTCSQYVSVQVTSPSLHCSLQIHEEPY